MLYWRIGRQILEQQCLEGWGSEVIDRLSLDLGFNKFPHIFQASSRETLHLWEFSHYPGEPIVQEVLAQITWYHYNFDRTLPAPQSELARQILKDPYTLIF